MRVIRQPYLVDRLVIQELNRETPSLAVVYRNEFDMAVAAFILQNNDLKKIKVSSIIIAIVNVYFVRTFSLRMYVWLILTGPESFLSSLHT